MSVAGARAQVSVARGCTQGVDIYEGGRDVSRDFKVTRCGRDLGTFTLCEQSEFRALSVARETATTARRGMVSLATGGYRGATDFAQSPQAAFAFMMLAVCQTAWTLAAIWMVGMHGRTWFTGDSQKKLPAAGKCERREAMRSRHAQSERAIGCNAAKQVPRPASMSSSTADLLQCTGSCTCEEMRAATWRALETIGGELTCEMAKEGRVDEPERVMMFVRSVQQSTASLTCRHCLQS